MRTLETTVYTLDELKETFPEAYGKAFEKYQEKVFNWDTPWQEELFDSLKALIKQSGLVLRDYSLSSDSYRSFIRIDIPDRVEEMKGTRALAWLENNLFYKLRKSFTNTSSRYATEKSHKTKSPYTLAGYKRDCPLTGYCADEDFLSALLQSVKQGYSLKDSFAGLANVYSELLEKEEEFQRSEEAFKDWAEGMEFTEEGESV